MTAPKALWKFTIQHDPISKVSVQTRATEEQQRCRMPNQWDRDGADYLMRLWFGNNSEWAAQEITLHILPELFLSTANKKGPGRAQLTRLADLFRSFTRSFWQARDAAHLMMVYAMTWLPAYRARVRARVDHALSLDRFLAASRLELDAWSTMRPLADRRYANLTQLSAQLRHWYCVGIPLDQPPCSDHGDDDDAQWNRESKLLLAPYRQ